MLYKDFGELRLSRLGMGNMRLPTVGDSSVIERKQAKEIIDYAVLHGINYFDTAYVYHGGDSEKCLRRGAREISARQLLSGDQVFNWRKPRLQGRV